VSRILVLYHSQEYGNTHKMAVAVAEGATASGADVTLINTNEERLDIDRYRTFDAVALGSPDYFGYIAGTLKVFLDDWYIARKASDAGLTGKSIGLFYSHGGGGAVREPLEKLFGRLGTQVGETIESVGSPNEGILEACRTLAGRASPRRRALRKQHST